ncbi:MAG: hypothetical protein FJW37_12485 [Acidobacteria bacterium]|nr:hypothetical protein [Acidobacteriota bacterium]
MDSGIVLDWVKMPLVEPFRISNGSVSLKDAIVVSYQRDGVTGYGEASPMAGSFYSSVRVLPEKLERYGFRRAEFR